MKNLFIGYLVLNLLLEGLAAITLIGGTMGAFSIENLESGVWSMNYGFAAIAIAYSIFWVWPHRLRREAVADVKSGAVPT